MDQPSSGERALSDEPAAQPGTPQGPGKKRDAKSLSLVAAGMLTIVASVITLFVDKLSLPLRVSLILGLFGIGLTGAAVIMQAAPERWVRPVAAVAAGTVVLMTVTFFLAPHPGAASTPGQHRSILAACRKAASGMGQEETNEAGLTIEAIPA